MKILTKQQIIDRISAMYLNKARGFTIYHFVEFVGIDYAHFRRVYKQELPMTETIQRKISRALTALENGEAGPRMDIAGRKSIGYHRKEEQRPAMARSIGLQNVGGEIKMRIGIVNKYSFNPKKILK
jgi:hypothetical protein